MIWPWLLVMVVVLVLRRLPAQLWREQRARPFPSFGYVVASLTAEVAASGVMPLVILGVARVVEGNGVGAVPVAVGLGLSQMAIVWFGIGLVRRLARVGGLAARDFRAGDAGTRLVYDVLGWLQAPLLVVVFFFSLISPEQQESDFASLSRFAFVVGMGLISVAVYRIAHPHGALVMGLFAGASKTWVCSTA